MRSPGLCSAVVVLFFVFLLLTSGCRGGGPTPAESPSPSPSPGPTESPSLPVYNSTKGTYYASIQAAIDDARNGDTIVVSPGTYYENIDFKGKNITVQSENPSNPQTVAATIIDGGGNGSVVTFKRGETRGARLEGFTIQNGTGTVSENIPLNPRVGGGIYIENASPTIGYNVIRSNTAIMGGGIFIDGTSSPEIAHNTIADNESQGAGGGIAVFGSSSPVIYGNSIRGNHATGGTIFFPYGGGIAVSTTASVRAQDGTPWPRDNCPPAGLCLPGSGCSYQNNTFLGNTHMGGQSTNGCHVYFE